MNKGVLQSSQIQQMMDGNPNLWNINNMRPPLQHQSSFLSHTSSSSSLPLPNSWHEDHHNQDLPESWSQLLLGGFVDGEDRSSLSQFQTTSFVNHVKNEDLSPNRYLYVQESHEDFHKEDAKSPTWSPISSPPKSCITSYNSSNMLDFSTSKNADGKNSRPDRSLEYNSTSTTCGNVKKARVHPSSTLKVRKEKLGDRITALHQLVSPFGKTDTASVLLETVGYIRFLHSQVEALSLPYIGEVGNGSRNKRPQQSLLNEQSKKRKATALEQDGHGEKQEQDLRSRGLCLVPVSSTMQVGCPDNGADYWSPALGGGGGGGFR